MGLASGITYFAFHPKQLMLVIQWQLVCFKFFNQTGRSFSFVIQELYSEVLMPVCVFCLVFRGFDTIEDDTSLSLQTKETLLRHFKDRVAEDNWSFAGNRPEEEDCELLVKFHNIITEFKLMKPEYRIIFKDVTDRVGNRIACFVRKAASRYAGVKTIEEFDIYCWYVAGIVGEGLTCVFVGAGLGQASMINHPQVCKSMGLFLQKNNIIRDVHEDYTDGRCFWPENIWSKHFDNFEDVFYPKKDATLDCSSEIIINPLEHTNGYISYLTSLREQSVFRFCAIPQSMATATLELCFRNPIFFKRNVKISKGDAVQLMTEYSQDKHAIEGFIENLLLHDTNRAGEQLKVAAATIGQIRQIGGCSAKA
ncbi:putative Farnesyl-diphosphate farnesyltransferase [Seiridium unicorne]|uniref:Squalene synthase n=1 Tax=Seiridium unicorne TaxID=138068 RepID=A0ABR2V4B5_9PEZI